MEHLIHYVLSQRDLEELRYMEPGTPVLAINRGDEVHPPMLFVYSGNHYSIEGSDNTKHTFLTASEAAFFAANGHDRQGRLKLELTVYDNGKIFNSGARRIKRVLRDSRLPRTKLRLGYPARRIRAVNYGKAELHFGEGIFGQLAAILR